MSWEQPFTLITQMMLPDLRGEFVRAHDAGRNVDFFIENLVLTKVNLLSLTPTLESRVRHIWSEVGGNRSSDSGVYTTNTTGGAETRPRNVSLLYCIKY